MSGGVGLRQWKPYPAYKDSGVEWLGRVPEGWEVKRLKFQVANINQKCSEDDVDSPFVALEHIESWTGKLYLNENSKSDGLPNAYEANDILFCKLRPYLAKVYLARTHGICTAELLVLRSEEDMTPEYLYHFLLSRDVIDRITASTYGAKMPRANWEFIGNLPLPTPPKAEQQAIASFLDHQCARIDALIEKKRRLLELLEEKRRAVITQAVTRGLDPNAPMKDSGVEWLGRVPTNWLISRSLFYFDFVTSGSRAWAKFYSETGSPFVRIGNIRRESIEPDFSNLIYVDAPSGMEAERTTIREGDIFISITADIGSIGIASESVYGGYISQHIALCRPSLGSASPRYLAYALSSFVSKKQLLSFSYGGTKVQLSLTDVKSIHLALPPLSEQQAIAAYLDAETAAIDAQRQANEKSIALLREYRASLITHAVTGKIDVREYAPPQ
jgi:type I restriction enzyme S subunit